VLDAVAYDAASDVITLCPPRTAGDPRCARLGPDEISFALRPPSIAPAVRAPNLVMAAPRGEGNPPALRRRGDRLLFDGKDRWVDLPAKSRATLPTQPTPDLLWISHDGSRALVHRGAAAVGESDMWGTFHVDIFELVDPVAHRVIARDETCMGFQGVGSLSLDGDERALLVDMQRGISAAFAVVDLVHGRFAALDDGPSAGHTGNRPCTDYGGSRAWSTPVFAQPGIVSADLSTWRTQDAVVALETGHVTALVTGTFSQDGAAIEYVVDARTSVVVSPGPPGQGAPTVCAGVLHRTAAAAGTAAPPPRPATPGPGPAPRCVPASP